MTPIRAALLIIGGFGHALLWVSLVNRLHAIALPRKLMDALTLLCGAGVTLIPLAVGWALVYGGDLMQGAAWCYTLVCAVAGLLGLGHRVYVHAHRERLGALLNNHTVQHQVANLHGDALTAPGIPTWLSRIPGNQVLTITVHEKELAIPHLKSGPAGLRIAHLSDLHMSGRIAKAYFEAVVEQTNRAEPDMVAITGDIVEHPRCFEWIPDTLGRLCAPGGIYYVLGNHDKKVDVARLHAALADCGLIHVGGRWLETTVRNVPLVLAGNELPWFGPAAAMSTCPPHDANGLPLRVTLAHSPDQFNWAQANDVDLVLAGHNHGGQVCLPVVGAILAPSKHGVRYAAGAFRSGNTVLHVSRGTASHTPLRINCPPEVAVLVLRAGR
jgi:predicted MPP superfamily phosphohydrolase